MSYEWDWNEKTARMKAAAYGIPEDMHQSLILWVTLGRPQVNPGPFLSAVISNNLLGAVNHADDINIHLIPDYVRWFYNWAPSICWGSADALKGWKGTDAGKP